MMVLRLLVICAILFVTSISKEVLALEKQEKREKLALIEQLKSEGKIVYAIIPKNTDEPYYQIAGKGCVETAKKIGVNCVFYGSTRENMRHQVTDILDLIKAGVDGIAVSSIKKGYVASLISKEIKDWGKPMISFDSPLNSEIINSYIGTNNYLLGKALGIEIRKFKPNGGVYCIQTERQDSSNHNDRMRGIIDGMTKDGTESDRWKQISRCPQRTMGDYERGVKQMVGVLKGYKVDVFASTGGGPQFLPELYREAIAPFKEDIKSEKLIFANIDSIPVQLEYLKEGISSINVGQRPYEMGKWSVKTLKMLTNGKIVPIVINTGLTYCTQKNVQTCTD